MATLPDRPQPTVDAIYAAYEANQETGYRYHLGASLIGTECERSLWYSFRWASKATFSGRMLRLFQTGHLAEARFVADLRAAGIEVYDVDEDGKQFGVRDEFGHFGGSMDGCGIGFSEAPKTWHLCEFKTHNEKSFVKLQKEGLQKAKPRHYAQMQVYMHLSGMTRGFYLAVNKNTDELYQERIEYDATFALQLLAKANRVIQSEHAPRKLSNDPSWFECRFCDHRAVCHGDAMPERTCRSCINSTPVAGGTWHCQEADNAGADSELSREAQETGCLYHRYIPDFVHGTQIDAHQDTQGSWLIKYLLTGNREWIDDGSAI
jgi:hypothetical protein